MFDNVSFKVNNYSIAEFEQFTERIAEPVSFANDKCKCSWYNLHIVYYPNSRVLKVSNSLHKFYNAAVEGLGGFNHNAFTYKQFEETVALLEEVINRPANEMVLLGRFEYGLNIPTGHFQPYKDIIDRYQSIVTTATNPFYAYYNTNSKPYGKFCAFTDYTVKCYDKGKQMSIGENILRIEVVHRNIIMTRAILSLRKPTIKDLLNRSNWEKLYSKLKSLYDKIRMLGSPCENVEDYSKILCYANATVNRDFKKAFQKVMPQLKEAHDRMRDNPNSPHSLVSNAIPEIFEHLVNN